MSLRPEPPHPPWLPGGACYKGRKAMSAGRQGLTRGVCPRPCRDYSIRHASVRHAGREGPGRTRQLLKTPPTRAVRGPRKGSRPLLEAVSSKSTSEVQTGVLRFSPWAAWQEDRVGMLASTAWSSPEPPRRGSPGQTSLVRQTRPPGPL